MLGADVARICTGACCGAARTLSRTLLPVPRCCELGVAGGSASKNARLISTLPLLSHSLVTVPSTCREYQRLIEQTL